MRRTETRIGVLHASEGVPADVRQSGEMSCSWMDGMYSSGGAVS